MFSAPHGWSNQGSARSPTPTVALEGKEFGCVSRASASGCSMGPRIEQVK
jgi:hypothetical protein